MCFQALPAILSAVGTGMQVVNQNQAARDQDRAVAANLRQQMQKNAEGSARVAQEIQKVAASDAEPERAALEQDFMSALRRAKLDRGPDVGGGGSRFSTDTETLNLGTAEEGRRSASQLARIDAPTLQRQREGTGFADTATDLSLLAGRAQGLDFLSQLRLARARPNAGVDALGQGLSAFGHQYGQRARPMKPRMVDSTIPG